MRANGKKASFNILKSVNPLTPNKQKAEEMQIMALEWRWEFCL